MPTNRSQETNLFSNFRLTAINLTFSSCLTSFQGVGLALVQTTTDMDSVFEKCDIKVRLCSPLGPRARWVRYHVQPTTVTPTTQKLQERAICRGMRGGYRMTALTLEWPEMARISVGRRDFWTGLERRRVPQRPTSSS